MEMRAWLTDKEKEKLIEAIRSADHIHILDADTDNISWIEGFDIERNENKNCVNLIIHAYQPPEALIESIFN